MKRSVISPAAAKDILATATGEYVWAARTGQDAILRFDVGSPHLHVSEPFPGAAKFVGATRTALGRRVVLPTGRWHLFVECGLWRVTAMGMECSRTDAEQDSPEKVAQVTRCLSRLDGQKLTAIDQTEAGREWRFAFDLGGRLSIATEAVVASNAAEAVWTLFLEDGPNLSFMSDASFVLEEPTMAPA